MTELLRDILKTMLENGGEGIDEKTALAVAESPWEDNMDLLAAGHFVRSLFGPKATGTCAITNAKSGRCPENCAFCAQSSHYETGAPVYPLQGKEALLSQAQEMDRHNIGRFGIVTSGTTVSDKDLDTLCEAALSIRSSCRIKLCASLGLLTEEKALRLKQAGFDRYHHNLETARSYFDKICTTHDYDEDIATLRVARKAGLSICSCGIFGLGESWAQRVELLHTVRSEHADCVPVNFLCPVPGTPMGKRQPLERREALRIVALARLMLPHADINICGGRLSTLAEEQSFVLASGASCIMTGNYLTTRGLGYDDDDALLQALGSERR